MAVRIVLRPEEPVRRWAGSAALLLLIAAALPVALPVGLAPALAQEPIAASEVEPWVTDKGTAWAKPVLDVTDLGDEGWAVFDRHGVDMSFGRVGAGKKADMIGQLSRWGRREVVIYGQRTETRCIRLLFTPLCETRQPLFRVEALDVRVGNHVERLEGGDSRFRITAPLAAALAPSPSPPPMWVRLTLEGGRETVTHPIGESTVRALQTIYSLPLKEKNGPLPPEQEKPAPQPGSVAADPLPAQLAASLPSVQADHWRLMDGVPWSTPVVVRDRFDGDFVAVFDRDRQRDALMNREVGLVSLWGRPAIWLHAYATTVERSYASLQMRQPTLEVNGRSFALQGRNNRVPMDDELAAALRGATPGTVSVRYIDQDGTQRVHPVGDATVRAWATVYQRRTP